MAKKSVIARNEKRRRQVLANYKQQQALRDIIKSTKDDDERAAAQGRINGRRRPRNVSYVRVARRCELCGRPHGVMRKFGVCRICLRNAFCRGLVPGLRKASW